MSQDIHINTMFMSDVDKLVWRSNASFQIRDMVAKLHDSYKREVSSTIESLVSLENKVFRDFIDARKRGSRGVHTFQALARTIYSIRIARRDIEAKRRYIEKLAYDGS